jgi:hypothetical protein
VGPRFGYRLTFLVVGLSLLRGVITAVGSNPGGTVVSLIGLVVASVGLIVGLVEGLAEVVPGLAAALAAWLAAIIINLLTKNPPEVLRHCLAPARKRVHGSA